MFTLKEGLLDRKERVEGDWVSGSDPFLLESLFSENRLLDYRQVSNLSVDPLQRTLEKVSMDFLSLWNSCTQGNDRTLSYFG